MSDTKTPGDKTLHVSPKTLSLPKRPAEQNTVRQSFSHGRSKAVVVETVKRRAATPGGAKDAAPAGAPAASPRSAAAPAPPGRPTLGLSRPSPAAPAPAAAAPAARAPTPAAGTAPRPAAPSQPSGQAPAQPSAQPAGPPAGGRPTGIVLRTLTDAERDARVHALTDAKRREEEERRIAEENARRRAEREARDQKEREAAEARKREEEERRRQEDERKRRAEDEARRRLGEVTPPAPATPRPTDSRRPQNLDMIGRRPAPAAAQPTNKDAPRPAGAAARPAASAPAGRSAAADDEGDRKVVIRRPGMPLKIITPPKPKGPGGGNRDRRGRLTIASATSGEEERTRSVAAFRRRMQRMSGHRQVDDKEKIAREVTIPETITIQDLANRMAERAVDVIKLLMKQGQIHKITDTIDADTAQLVAEELGHTVRRVAEADVLEGLFDEPDLEEHLEPRPPVVTIMGHVDHGKTSLLDAIRKTDVVAGEAGGITQHIGAYQITTPSGAKITFIDTPGHAAFTAMRARGAKITDIVVLVVAADDGVMPQTVEAISHAKAAGVPMVVAINKMDKPDANPQRVRTELLQHNIQVESMGGDTLEFEVSALTGQGLDTLLEGLLLQAEVLDLKADPLRNAEGTVIEAKLDRGRGPVATVLVQRGLLEPGDIIVAGAEWGRVRALISDTGEMIEEAGPSYPAQVLGFNGTPDAGDRFAVVESEARAREITEYRARVKRERAAARASVNRGSLADMMRDLREGSGRKEFPLVIKGDVGGSVEAIVTALEKIGNEEVAARILHAGVGAITESDVTLAQASGAVIIGFNVRAHKEAREAAERAGIEIRYYNIIYNLVDDVRDAMSGLLAPTLREERLGEAKILEVFDVSKVGKVAGCRVMDGRVERGAHIRLIRDNVVIHEGGRLQTLKRFKDDVQSVVAGQECGMSFDNYDKIRVGDVIECFNVHEERRSL
ncbi:translation initiation factor IF-2 [Enterovirga aerilata]|uniref:Translation initiation factor IF-2 n=1 Tax=Enterovirga aerilata TaxID=2730920 RepID=A0A849I120_9HYPH|nr:translation initiation factor IF-2 [Enterovirga sp. DB1703]NNM71254.1 translation initiation factor IF-2 [Enterovirga sp. DB1703]